MRHVPDKPSLDGLEAKWGDRWEADGTYRFTPPATRDEVYSIDTPPPTVSGSLHIGHVFSYTHTDTVARYRRMRGKAVYYPMGWDDNGLPTERRVQNYFGVQCDPSLPYDPDFTPPPEPFDPPRAISRRNFVALCHELTVSDEAAFEHLWRLLGLSVDWTRTYATIDDHSRTVAQRAFLRNLARGEAYAAAAPVLWDVDFGTAVAQAELEDRERQGAFHRVAFHRDDGSLIHVETTRPELLPACVALVAHPDDERYQALFGTEVRTPLFEVAVPVLAHPLAEPDKGSGIAMICTFGDLTDVIWWRELELPARPVVGADGRLLPDPPDVIADPAARDRYAELAGRTVTQARRRIVEQLAASGDLDGDPWPVTHPVKFYEKGERPLEILTSRQWYLRNGGRDPGLQDVMLARGRELAWTPAHMQVRYENWVSGLNGDWLVSRQRYFGVPIPVWYAADEHGNPAYDRILVPAEEDLPVDPSSDVPAGYRPEQRGAPGGFVADPDVMDTWATSSLTPQIVTGWEADPDLFALTFPLDLRPQGQEIIRTWLFSSVVRAHLENDALPWAHAAISGWVLDPDRKKMSKSRGNVVTPAGLIEQYGADGVRYWAASGRPGTDTAFEEAQMRVGRRLAVKVLNASRFALRLGDGGPTGDVTEPLDRALLARLADTVDGCTAAFEQYDYARALEIAEAFHWSFCDDYLELVKGRAYGGGDEQATASALATLDLALSHLLRLFAPFLPFVTEEVWSWWQEGSIHRAPWPEAGELRDAAGDADPQVYEVAAAVLGEIRKAKTAAQRSLRTPVDEVVVHDRASRLAALRAALGDVSAAGTVTEVSLQEAPQPAVEVTLAPPES
jgi:valyl-tRNA synthetase